MYKKECPIKRERERKFQQIKPKIENTNAKTSKFTRQNCFAKKEIILKKKKKNIK